MQKILSALIMGLFLSLSVAPAYAFLGFSLGGDEKDKDTPAGESVKLEKCDKPFGTLAVVEPPADVGQALLDVGLPSPVGLIRMLIQQSNCFVVVERGKATKNPMQERDPVNSGMPRPGANIGAGQIASADFVLTPDVVFSNKDAGGLGIFGTLAGLFTGGLKFKEAQTGLSLADARASLQLAAAQGMARKSDSGSGGLALGGGAVGTLGAYENTAEGKVLAASFLDNWNNIVRSIRANPQMVRGEIDLKQ